jgi:tripartite ATP-independent transporter DctM subunit
VAAREERLLTLAVSGFIKGRAASAARFVAGAVGAAVALLLLVASLQFIAAERAVGAHLLALAALPAGFALIAWRLVRHAAGAFAPRVAVAVLAAALCAWIAMAPPHGALLGIALALLAVATVAGAPIFVGLGGTALLLLQSDGVPIAAVAVNHYSLVINPSLPAIPMFTLAGYLLAESRSPARLVELFDALFGRLRGGAALVAVLACTFFTCFTGASGVTILALGGLVMPLLAGAGYRPRDALGLVTGAGLPGVILLPALPLLLYAIVARVGIEDMFVGGLMPALLAFGVVAAWGIWRAPRRAAAARAPFSWPRVRAAAAAAKWELSLPLAPVAALASGLATPVEAAAVTAVYSLFIVAVVHRDLHVARDLPRVIAECGLLVGGILLVLGVALSLTNYMVDAEVPERLVQWVRGTIQSRWAFLLALNAVLLAAGCVMDIYTAIVVLAPLVTPLGLAYGVHPVHLGIVFLANLELGYLTPPVGMNLFFAAYRFGRPIAEVFRSVLPLFCALAVALAAVTAWPWLSIGLLSAFK